VQLGEDDLHARQSGPGFDINRDASAPVTHLDTAVGVQDDVDLGPVAREGLIDRVVDDLPEAVHQAGRSVRADVHARPFAHGFEPLEYLEVVG
jgi:hypothetical protein